MYWHDDGDMAPVSLHSDMTCVSRGKGREERREERGEKGRRNEGMYEGKVEREK